MPGRSGKSARELRQANPRAHDLRQDGPDSSGSQAEGRTGRVAPGLRQKVKDKRNNGKYHRRGAEIAEIIIFFTNRETAIGEKTTLSGKARWP